MRTDFGGIYPFPPFPCVCYLDVPGHSVWDTSYANDSAFSLLSSKGPATLHDSTQLDSLVELSWGQS